MSRLNENFWTDRYLNADTGWDIGYPSTPIKTFIDGLENKDLRILIPGAGNAYEAEYLYSEDFTNVDVLDIAKPALESLKKRINEIPESRLIHKDFFDHQGTYDLILEQTFFCALNPKLRENYALKMQDLLGANGILAGVLFDFPLSEEGPPFGGSQKEYKNLFSPYFEIKTLERCYNSIAPRNGNELFIILEARNNKA